MVYGSDMGNVSLYTASINKNPIFKNENFPLTRGGGFIPPPFSKIFKNIQKFLLNKGVYFTLNFFRGLHTIIRDLAEIIR